MTGLLKTSGLKRTFRYLKEQPKRSSIPQESIKDVYKQTTSRS
jgi:hypothetical protein